MSKEKILSHAYLPLQLLSPMVEYSEYSQASHPTQLLSPIVMYSASLSIFSNVTAKSNIWLYCFVTSFIPEAAVCRNFCCVHFPTVIFSNTTERSRNDAVSRKATSFITNATLFANRSSISTCTSTVTDARISTRDFSEPTMGGCKFFLLVFNSFIDTLLLSKFFIFTLGVL